MDAQRAFEVVADPTRRRILELLRTGEYPVGHLVQALGTAQPNVSKHLRTLSWAGLVQVRVDGPRRFYRLDGSGLQQIDAWLAPFRDHWADRLDDLEKHLDSMHDDGQES